MKDSQERRGVPARWGTRLVVFPHPYRPQFEKVTSREPPSRAGSPCPPAPSQKGAEGGRKGVWLVVSLRGQEAWEYHEPGPPNEPGPLAFSQLSPLTQPPFASVLNEVLHRVSVLVAMYRAMRLRFRCRFESCDAHSLDLQMGPFRGLFSSMAGCPKTAH